MSKDTSLTIPDSTSPIVMDVIISSLSPTDLSKLQEVSERTIAARDKAIEHADKSKISEDAAKASETAAKVSETHSKASETAAKASEVAAKASENAAKVSEVKAQGSQDAAKVSEVAAKGSADDAETRAQASAASAVEAKQAKQETDTIHLMVQVLETAALRSAQLSRDSESKAKASETEAKASEIRAKNSENAAKASEVDAGNHAITATGQATKAETIANKFGDVDQAITKATQQADRSAAEATKAKGSAADALGSANKAETEATKAKTEATTSQTQAAASRTAANESAASSVSAQQFSAEAKSHAIDAEVSESNASVHATTATKQATKAEGIANKFGDVDQAITKATVQADKSEAAAGRSTAQANIATAQAGIATTQANAAKAAKDEAVAIVHKGEGSVTPGAGKYPVANAKGHLDIGWTPMLQAMYPHSGVIGSVDKTTLFYFHTSIATYSNRFDIAGPGFAANINGRFVRVKGSTPITLPEAESTAARAVAFDDIFLNWDGQVQTYRSIIPHRTATGYDADAIALEHGWAKVNTGLYRNGDTYVLLLGRVARRNQGAYHPVFNPEGSKPLKNTLPIHTGYTAWFRSNINVQSVADCFNGDHFQTDWGKIGNLAQGRSDKKPYDAIYADDFTPLYYSAKNVIDRQALLFDNFNRAVAGETFMGAEGVNETHLKVVSVTFHSEWNISVIIFHAPIYKGWAPDDVIVTLNDGTTLERGHNGGNRFQLENDSIEVTGDASSKISVGDMVFVRGKNQNTQYYNIASVARPQFLMVDIIGSLDAMPPEWKTEGIPGNWLAVGEEGESLIPDGTDKNFKLSRKCLECYLVLRTDDNGATWIDGTADYALHFESSDNGNKWVWDANRCLMVFYRTSANPFELTTNRRVTAYQDRVDAVVNGSANQGALACSNLINKICVSSSFRKPTSQLESLGSFSVSPNGLTLRNFNNEGRVEHGSLSSGFGGVRGEFLPACKMFPFIADNGRFHIIYKELKHNGTQWGDDNKFNIVNNQTTVTDLNGEKVIVGQKRVALPYHSNDGDKY